MELEPHALLRINAHEEIFLPVEVRVEWLSKQAALRMRASAMVGSRISQLDDAIRARALLSIMQLPSTPATGSQTQAATSEQGAGSAGAEDEKAGTTRQEGEGCVAVEGQGRHHVRRGSSEPPLDARDLEVLARMAVAKIKVVLFQLASPEEKKERQQQGKDVFDVYEGLLTSEDLERAAKEGFPTLDVDTLLHPNHFRYRSLIAARHRYLLRKLAVLLDMDEGVDLLLARAADTEKLQDSLADVDLSLDDEEQEGRDADQSSSPPLEPDLLQQKENARRRGSSSSSSSSSSQSAAASALTSPSGSGAAVTAAAVVSAAGAVGKSSSLKIASTLRTSWEKDTGSEDTTEGETDEETMTPHAAHRRDVSDVSPSH